MEKLKLSDIKKQLPIKIQLNMYYGHLRDWVNNRYDYTLDFDIYLPTKKMNLQRPLCWTLSQKQELILSLIKGIKIPNFTVIVYTPNEKERQSVFKIIDGKQRFTTLISFCKNEFPITIKGSDYFYKDLPLDITEIINHFDIHFDQTYEYWDELISDDVKIAWFEQINFAGTKQDIEHLNNLKTIKS